jgi:hypothetical protein
MGILRDMGEREQQSVRARANILPIPTPGSERPALAYLSELYQKEEQHDHRRHSKGVQNHLRIF